MTRTLRFVSSPLAGHILAVQPDGPALVPSAEFSAISLAFPSRQLDFRNKPTSSSVLPASQLVSSKSYQPPIFRAAALRRIEIHQASRTTAVASAVDIIEETTDQHHQQRPRLADFVLPSNHRKVTFRPFEQWPPTPIAEPPTPPGQPESDEDNFIPNLSDCEVISDVGPSSEDDIPSPEPAPTPPPTRLIRVRNAKTNETRYLGLSQLLRTSPRHRIVRHY
ncbi:hypothetical protein OUZ56_012175 [Daphnia magna]|uniref:Uncharacterized protein n=1 Tax=Daphnia magna TaxID=35525 RepID=A0ABQ9Z289_9CRUS|nr:hypothetical protein OUZ56_012175 [Daphnia magna]